MENVENNFLILKYIKMKNTLWEIGFSFQCRMKVHTLVIMKKKEEPNKPNKSFWFIAFLLLFFFTANFEDLHNKLPDDLLLEAFKEMWKIIIFG